MRVDPVRPPQSPAPERRDDHPPQKPREPISGDSRTSLGLGATGTVAASIAGEGFLDLEKTLTHIFFSSFLEV